MAPWHTFCQAHSVEITQTTAREALYWCIQEVVEHRRANTNVPNQQNLQLFRGLFSADGNVAEWDYGRQGAWLNPVLFSLVKGRRLLSVDTVPLLQFLVPGPTITAGVDNTLRAEMRQFDPRTRPAWFEPTP